MARKHVTPTPVTPTPVAPLAPTNAGKAAPTVQANTWVLAPSGSRKAPPAAHTVAGLALALLAQHGNNVPYTALQFAIGNGAVTNGGRQTNKVHALKPLLVYMAANWGYGFACTNGMVQCTHVPACGPYLPGAKVGA